MEEIIKLNEKLTTNFKNRDKEQVEKFLPTLSLIDKESVEVCEKYNIVFTKYSQLIVLTQDAQTLTQALALAKKMNFIDAYYEDPKRLNQLVTNVIKRMAKCDAAGISYKKADGHFENFIFSERLFNQVVSNLKESSRKIIETPSDETEKEEKLDIAEVKEDALRILEQFAIIEQKDAIYKRLDEIQNNGFSEKEMLMEAFKICAGNTELLSDAIDELLEKNKEDKVSLGKAA